MSKNKIVKWVALGVGILLLAAMLTAFVIVRGRMREDTSADGREGYVAADSAQTMNVLIAGKDRASGLHDVLMLLHWDRSAGRVCVLQIPRDTYAAYTDGSYRKLNGAAARLGGMDALCAFLSESLGIAIDRYVSMDLDVLSEIVDAIGGVSITLPDALFYEDPAQGLSIRLPAGEQVLDGQRAEYFVRYRMGYVRGDLGRMDAQKLFLTALARQIKSSLTMSAALRVATSVLPKIETNLALKDMTALVRSAFSFDEQNVLLATLPGEEAVAEKSGASYYVLSSSATEELLAQYFGATEHLDPNGVFRNAKYTRFCEIYDGYSPYDVHSMGQIAAEGIEIEKTDR